MKTITIGLLESKGACANQVNLFRDTFGESAELTARNWKRAVTAGIDVRWASNLLSQAGLEAYARAEMPAQAAYDKAIKIAGEDFDKAINVDWAAYVIAVNKAWAAYDKTLCAALLRALKASD